MKGSLERFFFFFTAHLSKTNNIYLCLWPSVRLAEASNTAVAVKNLQRSLSETTLKYERLKKVC